MINTQRILLLLFLWLSFSASATDSDELTTRQGFSMVPFQSSEDHGCKILSDRWRNKEDFDCLKIDLNDGAGGPFIFMTMADTINTSGPKHGGASMQFLFYHDWPWASFWDCLTGNQGNKLCNTADMTKQCEAYHGPDWYATAWSSFAQGGPLADNKELPLDLNKGVSGLYIFSCQYNGGNSAGRANGMQFRISSDYDSAKALQACNYGGHPNWRVAKFDNGKPADLNAGNSGKYVYLCVSDATSPYPGAKHL